MLPFKKVDKQAGAWLVKMNSEAATKADHEAFFRWLEGSESHQLAYLQAEQLWNSCDRVRFTEKNWTLAKTSMVVSAACTVFAIALYLFNPNVNNSPSMAYSSNGQLNSEYLLSDGSVVTLYRDTSIMFEDQEERRELKLLKGEIFISVIPGKAFDVIHEGVKVRVMGTQFSVKDTGDDLRVTVLEGRVALYENGGGESETLLSEIGANQRLNFLDSLNGGLPETVDARLEVAWKDGILVFKGIPLIEALAKVNQHLTKTIKVTDNLLAVKKVTGVISIRSAESAAEALAASVSAQISYDVGSHEIVLLSKLEQ